MDWHSVAYFLAEHSDTMMALLDREGRIRMLSHSMEKVLGHCLPDVEGRTWLEVAVPEPEQRLAESRFQRAMSGGLHQCECRCLTREGKLLACKLEMDPVGSGEMQGLVLTIREFAPVDLQGSLDMNAQMIYEICIAPESFGLIKRAFNATTFQEVAFQDRLHCYRQIHGQESPCPDCPVLRDDQEGWPRYAVRWQDSHEGVGRIEAKIAWKVDAETARVGTSPVSEALLLEFTRAKIGHLAGRAGLSRRERDILDALLLGRTQEDMAKMLGISARTVKFHQRNVLDKLGADSRVDLIRLIL